MLAPAFTGEDINAALFYCTQLPGLPPVAIFLKVLCRFLRQIGSFYAPKRCIKYQERLLAPKKQAILTYRKVCNEIEKPRIFYFRDHWLQGFF